jgi:hypothetical protein
LGVQKYMDQPFVPKLFRVNINKSVGKPAYTQYIPYSAYN